MSCFREVCNNFGQDGMFQNLQWQCLQKQAMPLPATQDRPNSYSAGDQLQS